MWSHLSTWVWRQITQWLNKEPEGLRPPSTDYERLKFELRPADVILVEGQSRVGEIIKMITLSHWTHALLYVGRLHDITDPPSRALLEKHYRGNPNEPLVVEAVLGKGTIISPLNHYRPFNMRVCRPQGLTRNDMTRVLRYALHRLGTNYNIRQLLDLARFLFPYGLLPRHWRSSLFEHNAGIPTRTVCSSLIAEAFQQVRFPILPILDYDQYGFVRLSQRNSRLYTPHDFDYSPYFEVLKFPRPDFAELAHYRDLPWKDTATPLADAPRLLPNAARHLATHDAHSSAQ